MNYISSIERYHEYRQAIHELLESILTGIAAPGLSGSDDKLRTALCSLSGHYPFVDLIYSLNQKGVQTSSNIACVNNHIATHSDDSGKDRSQRPYFRLVKEGDAGSAITEPYLSSAGGKLCLSAIVAGNSKNAREGYIVIDIDLTRLIAFLMGDSIRRRFAFFFRLVYAVVAIALFAVVGLLLYAAYSEIAVLFTSGGEMKDMYLRPFGSVIFVTLGLALFDLGKTILEEEVLMHKDIFRHSSTRRTITRFMAAILIAVSIEALLIMFKASLAEGHDVMPGVWMMLSAVALLIGLGIYVALGARAEKTLLSSKKISQIP